MRHRKLRYQLNRYTSWRTATIRGLVRNVFKYETIHTTLTRAKAVQPVLEKLISLGKENSLSGKRLAFRILGDHALVSLLFKDIAVRFKDRPGGYTRILKYDTRRGDGATMVIFELTEIKPKTKSAKSKKNLTVKEAVETNEKDLLTEQKAESSKQPKSQNKISSAEDKPKKETKKPSKNFLGGIRKIFKKERDSL
jgi:large subunit ribosomal protein L17